MGTQGLGIVGLIGWQAESTWIQRSWIHHQRVSPTRRCHFRSIRDPAISAADRFRLNGHAAAHGHLTGPRCQPVALIDYEIMSLRGYLVMKGYIGRKCLRGPREEVHVVKAWTSGFACFSGSRSQSRGPVSSPTKPFIPRKGIDELFNKSFPVGRQGYVFGAWYYRCYGTAHFAALFCTLEPNCRLIGVYFLVFELVTNSNSYYSNRLCFGPEQKYVNNLFPRYPYYSLLIK